MVRYYLPTSRTPKKCDVFPALPFLTQVQPNHSAPLFPPCLVKCGIIPFSFLASVKALLVGGMAVPGTTAVGCLGPLLCLPPITATTN